MTDNIDDETPKIKSSPWPRWVFIALILSITTMSVLWFCLPRLQAHSYKVIFLIGNDKVRYWSMRKLATPELRAEADIISDCCLMIIHEPNSEFLDGEVLSFLSRLGRHPNVDMEAFIGELDNPDAEVRQSVIRFLGNQRDGASPAIPKLIKAVKHYERGAVTALSMIGPKAIPSLIRHIQEGTSEDRRLLLPVLFRMGKQASPAIPTLIPFLKDRNLDVVYSAIVTLGAIGPDAAPAIPALIKLLSNPHKKLRKNAIRSLGNIGPAAKPARPELKGLLEDPSEDIRAEALNALNKIESKYKF
ncbi:MAG: HEAT repeat domain-containing protein [Planctomycetota bacterium]|nr:HEAT repeat domain-containing protein [Planctomycetota bacterium]